MDIQSRSAEPGDTVPLAAMIPSIGWFTIKRSYGFKSSSGKQK